jgi:predicted transport protein
MSYENQLDDKITNELVKITRTVLEQNYFTFCNQNYFQNTGLVMGAPSSAVLSEVYLQHLEHTEIIKIITQHNILGHFRYVDDILMIYDENSTDIHEVYIAFNNIAPTIKFTIETENDNNINFLDIAIQKKKNKLRLRVHHKPTTTEDIIPKALVTPQQRKTRGHMVNSMN